MEPVEGLEVDQRVDLLGGDPHRARSPERRCRHRHRRGDGRARRDSFGWARGAGRLERRRAALRRERLVDDLLAERLAPQRIGEGIHDLQALEGILRVEEARLVGGVLLDEDDPPAVTAIDRRAADDHRDVQPAVMQFFDAERHLLRGRDEQRAEADRVGVHLDRLLDDRVQRHLLAEVEDGVAVVGEDRVDKVLADVVDIAEDRRQHHLALGVAFLAFQVRLHLQRRTSSSPRPIAGRTAGSARPRRTCRRPLSSPGAGPRSAHRPPRWSSPPRPPLQGRHGRFADPLADRQIDQRLHPFLLAVEDLVVDLLVGREPRGRVGDLGLGRQGCALRRR